MNEEPGRLQSMGLAKGWTRLSDLHVSWALWSWGSPSCGGSAAILD